MADPSLAGIVPEVTRPIQVSPTCDGRRPQRSPSRPPTRSTEVDGIPVTPVSRPSSISPRCLSKRQLERALNEVEVRWPDRSGVAPELLERHPGRRGTANLRALMDANASPAGSPATTSRRRFVALLDAMVCRGRGSMPTSPARPLLRGRLPLAGAAARRRARRTCRPRHPPGVRDRPRAGSDPLATGWRVMRITWHQLRDEPQAVAATCGSCSSDEPSFDPRSGQIDGPSGRSPLPLAYG